MSQIIFMDGQCLRKLLANPLAISISPWMFKFNGAMLYFMFLADCIKWMNFLGLFVFRKHF
ncbi:MAG: hypothetical protein QME07_07885 [bacterium]|nr:hypothetical protein [bacterium]